MSSRYSRPHTPPEPPPRQRSRASSGRKKSSPSASKNSSSLRSLDESRYEKSYKKSSSSSSSYHSSKTYSSEKYKSASRKAESEKEPRSRDRSGSRSKYSSKGNDYSTESSREYKATREVNYPSGSKYSSKNTHLHHPTYVDSSYSVEKTRYSDKNLGGSSLPPSYGDKYSSKKYTEEDYDLYPADKPLSRYSSSASGRHEATASYSTSSVGLYSSYHSHGSYDAYGSSYDSRGGYGTSDKALSYESDKYTSSGYSSHHLSQAPLLPRNKMSSGEYSDTKLGSRGRMYPGDDRRLYQDYSSSSMCSTRSLVRGSSASTYTTYGGDYSLHRTPERPVLNRYVIGDSVVYGSPGHSPKDLCPASPRRCSPNPPSPQPLMGRTYTGYPAGNRGYASSSNRIPLATSSQYPSSSLVGRRGASSRRPPSPPPPRRPPSPSPHSSHMKSSYTGTKEKSYEGPRSKDRYVSKPNTARSPARNSRATATSRIEINSRGDRDKRKELERRPAGSREKTQPDNSAKRARTGTGEHNSGYHHNSSRGWNVKETHTAAPSNHVSSSNKNRRPRTPPAVVARSGGRGVDMPRDTRRGDNRDKDKGRRMEDRLGPSPSQNQNTRRSPAVRPRPTRRAASPRDRRTGTGRRHTDLRQWIESRKSEGGKKLTSPNRPRQVTKNQGRSNDRPTNGRRRRQGAGDAKKRLARRRAVPTKRNKILKKYQRLTRRGGKARGSSSRLKRDNREGRGGGGNESSKGKEEGRGEASRAPGSTATIHRVIKKPKFMSQVNRMVLKPRVIRKPTQKLLKDPKEEENINKERSETQEKGSGISDEKQLTSSSSATNTNNPSIGDSSNNNTNPPCTSASAPEASKHSSSSSHSDTTTPSASNTMPVTASSL